MLRISLTPGYSSIAATRHYLVFYRLQFHCRYAALARCGTDTAPLPLCGINIKPIFLLSLRLMRMEYEILILRGLRGLRGLFLFLAIKFRLIIDFIIR